MRPRLAGFQRPLTLPDPVSRVGSSWALSRYVLRGYDDHGECRGDQGTLYLVREHHHFWFSAPSRWLLLSSVLDVFVVSILATFGILMTPIPI